MQNCRIDPDFTSQEFVVETFDKILGEILQLLPEIRKTRWSKKSDFYTLFLVLAEHRRQLPLSAEARIKIREKLENFAIQVDQFGKAQEKAKARFSTNVKDYSKGVIRAESDLGSRRNRAIALEEELAGLWKAKSGRM